jgi:hypothetical protein
LQILLLVLRIKFIFAIQKSGQEVQPLPENKIRLSYSEINPNPHCLGMGKMKISPGWLKLNI